MPQIRGGETLLIAADSAVAATALAALLMGQLLRARRKAMRKHARDAVRRVLRDGTERRELAECTAFLADCGRLGGMKKGKVRKRILVYTDPEQAQRNRRYVPDSSPHAVDGAAAFVALLSDLPAEWIADCYTGRRGS